MDLSWMAWTWPTAAVVVFIFLSIIVMVIWEVKYPGGNPRRGIFGIDTTRGDRLFISIIGSAFISLAWLFFMSTPLWGALALSFLWFIIVFRWV